MDRVLTVVQAARRRMTAAEVAARAGQGLLAGASTGAALVAASKLLGPWMDVAPWWALLGGGVVLGAGLGALAGWARARRSATMATAAGVLDRAAGLDDRLRSAVELHDRARASGFVPLAIADAQRVAATVDAHRLVPVKWGRPWAIAPAVAAAGVLVGWLVPAGLLGDPSEWFARSPEAIAEAREAAQRREAAAAIQTVREQLSPPGPDARDAEALRHREVLDEIDRELRSGQITGQEATRRAAAELRRAADRVEDRAATDAEAKRALREQLSRAARTADQSDSAIARALKDGDLSAAGSAAADLMRRAPSMSPEERARAASELRDLADRVGEASSAAGAPTPPGDDESRALDEMTRALEQAGAARDEARAAAEAVAQAQSTQEAQRALEERGVPPDRAESLAQQAAEARRTREAQQQAERERQDLADAMRRAADDLEPQPRPQPAGQDGATGAQDGGTTRPPPTDGASGSTGSDGASGATGSSGVNGSTGQSGQSGSTSSDGAVGATGPTGEQRTPGATGAAGEPGATGASEATGATGASGSTGANGGTGASGATSASPSTGATGSTSSAGSTGATGTAGTTGSSGASGASGASSRPAQGTGQSGESARTGATGTQAATGAGGTSGSTGASGATGSTGGSTGAQREPTNAGSTPREADGPTGASGVTGASGASGTTGAGPTPPTGTPSPTGGAPTGNVAPSSTGPNSSMAPTGPQRRDPSTPTGATGSTGQSSRPPASEQNAPPGGMVGDQSAQPDTTERTGQRGSTGSPNSGATGSPGSTGATAPGAAGERGATGSQGSTGASGASGATGASGSQREPGAQGSTGATSSTGGATGATGTTGGTGASGGTAGGATGSTGSTGAGGTQQPDNSTQPSGDGSRTGNEQGGPDSGAQRSGQDGGPRGVDDLVKRLEQMAKEQPQPGGGERPSREEAERLREQARELLERATPEQREAIERAAREWAQKQPPGARAEQPSQTDGSNGPAGPNLGGAPTPRAGDGAGPKRRAESAPGTGSRIEDVDARRRPDGAPTGKEPVVSEWLGDGSKERTPAQSAEAQAILREAAQSAQQALDDRTVSSRYSKLLERYFRRLPSAVGVRPAGDAPPPPPPAAPARDVP